MALCVACWLDADAALQLAAPGGEGVATLHVTLAYIPNAGPDDLETVRAVCARAGFEQQPLTGVSNGYGVFRDTGDGRDAFWAAIDMPGLAEFRDEICDALCDVDLEPSATHGWSPHITIGYVESGTTVVIGPGTPIPLVFRSVAIVTPEMPPEQRQELPFLGVQLLKEVPTVSDVHVDAPVGSETSARKRKKKPRTEISIATVMKADDEQQILGGIVLQPDVEDSQGDVISKDDIEQAAHRFLGNLTPIGLQHRELAPDDVRPVESYLAPVDFTVETPRGPELVRKGSWIVAAHIPDPDLWEYAKKNFTGWSIAGMGKRSPLLT